MGCIAQVFFPWKPKTAKYAGNWDPNASQPWTYKLQRWILSNTLLTKNMQVLVYGEWESQSKNVKPFFTASYTEADKTPIAPRKLDAPISVVFVGTLSPGKRPMYAVGLIEALSKKAIDITLTLYGHGKELESLQQYISDNNLQKIILLKGNQPQQVIRQAYTESHFVILPSRSEGWPKVIAEGMFWGCVPIASRVSCLANMLDDGDRGLLLKMDFDHDTDLLFNTINDPQGYAEKAMKSIEWSRKYTLDLFESEIKSLLKR
jgi:glycosyltransferase involved in cell wall biosynthesis